MDEKKKRPPWDELLNALGGGLTLALAHMKYKNMLRISQCYTPAELLQNQDGYVLIFVLAGSRLVYALWMLLTWKFSRDLMSGIVNVFSGLCWTLALLVCKPAYWDTEMKAIWLFVLVFLLGLGCWDLWKYRKQKLLAEAL